MLPHALDGACGDAGVSHRRVQHQIEQILVLDIVLLVQPQGLEQVVGVLGFAGFPLGYPRFRFADDFGGRSLRQLDPCALADAIDGMLECGEKDRDRLSVQLHVRLQRPARRGDSIDASVRVIAGGVANVVLHVPDDGVRPVCHVQRAIVPDLEVRGAEVGVRREQEIRRFGPGYVTAHLIESQRVLLDSEECDHVQNDEVPFHSRR